MLLTSRTMSGGKDIDDCLFTTRTRERAWFPYWGGLMGLIIVSNREPLRCEEGSWTPSVGGLTTALLPVLMERGGVWVAWGEEEVDEKPCISYPADDPRLTVHRLTLSESEVENYYYGLANRVLWPICHYFTEQMDLQRHYYRDYSQVNWRFAEQTAELYNEGDLIWVQDYQLMLVPNLLRKAQPEARIGYFHHIPWPAVEVWRMLPWAQELTEGLLGADVVGFHTEEYVKNFLEAAEELVGAEVHGSQVNWNGREIRVEVHPIGIDTEHFTKLAQDPKVQERAEAIRQEVASDYILLGIDRLDYTKGVLERLLAFERFLEDSPEYVGRVSLYQIAAPSRTRVDSYQELKSAVDEVAGRINGAYMRDGWVPVRYYYRSYPQDELAAFYLAADVALLTPLRDGMNVVAQEFTWVTERGTLILSNLTGAAQVLTKTFLINPLDIEGVARTLKMVLDMSLEERKKRLIKAKEQVKELDVHGWADRFLAALENGESSPS